MISQWLFTVSKYGKVGRVEVRLTMEKSAYLKRSERNSKHWDGRSDRQAGRTEKVSLGLVLSWICMSAPREDEHLPPQAAPE